MARSQCRGSQRSVELKKFPPGQWNPTYRITAASGESVLRRKPFGRLLPSAHAVDRGYRLISACVRSISRCRSRRAVRRSSIIGTIFYVMELATGRANANRALPDFDPETRARMYEQLRRRAGRFAHDRSDAADLGEFGKPGNYFERPAMRSTRQYRDSETDYVPEIERLIAFLPETVQQQSRTAIVHGDCRVNNVLFNSDGASTAVLDWELPTSAIRWRNFPISRCSGRCPPKAAPDSPDSILPELGIPTLGEIVSAIRSDPECRCVRARLVFRLQSSPGSGDRPGHQEAGDQQHGVQP